MLHIFQPDARVPAGIYGEHLRKRGIAFRTVRLFDGEPLPDPCAVSGLILLGGYMGVHDREQYPFLAPLEAYLRSLVAEQTPCLGICLGGQLLASALGGRVHRNRCGERGVHAVRLSHAGRCDPCLSGMPEAFEAFQWHNDSFEAPPGATLLASSERCPGQAFRFGSAVGLQFHPEVDREIVTDWARQSGAGEESAAEFSRIDGEYRRTSLKLFDNFLLTLAHS